MRLLLMVSPGEIKHTTGKAHARSALLRLGDVGYDAARSIWNGMIGRRPALIACCMEPVDIIVAVNFARTSMH